MSPTPTPNVDIQTITGSTLIRLLSSLMDSCGCRSPFVSLRGRLATNYQMRENIQVHYYLNLDTRLSVLLVWANIGDFVHTLMPMIASLRTIESIIVCTWTPGSLAALCGCRGVHTIWSCLNPPLLLKDSKVMDGTKVICSCQSSANWGRIISTV